MEKKYIEPRPYLRETDLEFEAFRETVYDSEFSRKMAKARREMQQL